jgi:hypothetical protein
MKRERMEGLLGAEEAKAHHTPSSAWLSSASFSLLV